MRALKRQLIRMTAFDRTARVPQHRQTLPDDVLQRFPSRVCAEARLHVPPGTHTNANADIACKGRYSAPFHVKRRVLQSIRKLASF
jgi:hypothetical protein